MAIRHMNPVFEGYFADPYVLRVGNTWYAYGTAPSGPGDDNKVFPILRSTDFVKWEPAGRAMVPVAGRENVNYWAPAVAERDGRYLLYYSMADGPTDDYHRLRVAEADSPLGPFRDVGKNILGDDDFTIDADVFRDPRDGQWYLFYARDFFDDRVGTGTAVVPLKDDMITPDGSPRTVIRAVADWQIFQRDRMHYGKAWEAWHTVEGPCVVHRGGRYYCLYSGGPYYDESYGVGFGVADHPMGPYTDAYAEGGPVILRGNKEILGPGHNSVTTGPDGQDYIVYHAWDPKMSARRMFIDPLIWTPDGPRCDGPTIGGRRP